MKRTNLFISLACTLVLVAVMAAPAMAAEQKSVGATVTVKTFISVSIGGPALTPPATGMDFTSLNPGETNVAETHQGDTTGAIILTVEKETNVDCDIDIKGDDFTGPATLTIDNAQWSITKDIVDAKPLTNADQAIGTTFTVKAPVESLDVNVWHWISIPAGQMAGDYSTTIYYDVSQSP